MIRKVGLDPNIPEEVDQAYEIFLEKGLVTKITENPPTYSHWPQICLMKRNISVAEYATCLARDPYTTKKPAVSTATFSRVPTEAKKPPAYTPTASTEGWKQRPQIPEPTNPQKPPPPPKMQQPPQPARWEATSPQQKPYYQQ